MPGLSREAVSPVPSDRSWSGACCTLLHLCQGEGLGPSGWRDKQVAGWGSGGMVSKAGQVMSEVKREPQMSKKGLGLITGEVQPESSGRGFQLPWMKLMKS